MGKSTGLIAILIGMVLAVITGILVGKDIGENKANEHWRPTVVSYQHEIDSLHCRIDSALAEIDFAYAAKQRTIVKTKYKYIIQQQEHEKEQYFSLDTTGRVAYFRDRVLKLMRKPVTPSFIDNEGIDEPLIHN